MKANERPLNQASQEGPRRNHGSAVYRARVRKVGAETVDCNAQGAEVIRG